MKIAAITVSYNDSYKIKEWKRWHSEYKDCLDLHVIVDNGSTQEELSLLEEFFPFSIIIKLGYNGGSTKAYNEGIRYALSRPEITHIALIGNDVRIQSAGLLECVKLLEADTQLGMVSPILLNADSNVVADFGDIITKDLSLIEFGKGKKLKEIPIDWRYCEAVTGGMNVSKRSFYETTVGLQDENLFMYSDEVDMGLRARKVGVKLAVTKDALSWHQHINPPGQTKRYPFSRYLIARNKTYLGKKHFGLKKSFEVFSHFFFLNLLVFAKNFFLFKWNMLEDPWWSMLGAVNGLVGNMKKNKYSSL